MRLVTMVIVTQVCRVNSSTLYLIILLAWRTQLVVVLVIRQLVDHIVFVPAVGDTVVIALLFEGVNVMDFVVSLLSANCPQKEAVVT